MSAGVVTRGPDTAAAMLSLPSWYGKVSMLGDFAHRRLAPGLLRQLDDWLAGWVDDSRRTLGAHWLGAYLGAPLLRFAWSPDVVGPGWWLGVLMPSCDRAGRYFPLLVVRALATSPGDVAARRLDDWLDRVTEAATGTLDDAASVEAFEHALAAADAAVASPTSVDAATATSTATATPAGADIPGALPTAAPPAWAARLASAAGESHWWTRGDDGIDSAVTTTPGLPDAATLTKLLLQDGA